MATLRQKKYYICRISIIHNQDHLAKSHKATTTTIQEIRYKSLQVNTTHNHWIIVERVPLATNMDWTPINSLDSKSPNFKFKKI